MSATDKENSNFFVDFGKPVSQQQQQPTKKKEDAVLVLAPFRSPPCLPFGNVRIGSTKTLALLVQNPSPEDEVVEFSTLSGEDKGFKIVTETGSVSVGGNGSAVVRIKWTPRQTGNVRAGVVAMAKSAGRRFQVFMLGFGLSADTSATAASHDENVHSSSLSMESHAKRKAESVNPPVKRPALNGIPPAKAPTRPVLKEQVSVVRKLSVRPAGSKSRLQLQKPSAIAASSYVARNDMFDDGWMSKLEVAFTKWLNFELVGAESSFTNLSQGPTYGHYTRALERGQTRRLASLMYQSDSFRTIFDKLVAEVDAGKLALRADLSPYADLGARSAFAQLLLNYSPVWLVLGLETVLGKTINDYEMSTLRMLIDEHVLMAREWAIYVENHGFGTADRAMFETKLRRMTLKKFLLLVLFLDKAKLTRLLPGNPCLFNYDAEIKSSRDILIKFSTQYLSGEGDVTRHLMLLGYSVSCKQSALDEYNFAVSNLATDLRDGIRLAKLVEVLSGDFTLLQEMRFPVSTRTNMLHNSLKILEKLQRLGVPIHARGGVVTAKDLVDGHREKTLLLLWNVIFKWKVSLLLSPEVLKDEVDCVKRDHIKAFGSVRGEDDAIEIQYFNSAELELLLQWCRCVCAFYNIPVNNFSASFADGRAFCALMSYYHPNLLDFNDVKHTQPKQEDSEDEGEYTGSGWTKTFTFSRKPEEVPYALYNFQLFNNKVQELGGMPSLLRGNDAVRSGLDEKIVITVVSYLCARLLVLRREIKAAKIIQNCFRRYRSHRMLRKRVTAARIIYRACCTYMGKRKLGRVAEKRANAANVVQRSWKRYQFCKKIQSTSAIKKFQAHAHGFLERRRVDNLQGFALRFQSQCRRFLARKKCHEERRVTLFQAQCRGLLTRKKFEATRKFVIDLQTALRSFLVRRHNSQLRSIVAVQARCRGFLARQKTDQARKQIVQCQAFIRMFLARVHYARILHFVTQFQASVRGMLQRKNFQTQSLAALKIQTYYRGFRACQIAKKMRAARSIQSAYRMHKQRVAFLKLKAAVAVFETRLKAVLMQREMREKYLSKYAAIVRLQALWRGRRARKQVSILSWTTKLQASCRGWLQRSRFLAQRNSACKIQATYRMYRDRSKFTSLCRAAIVIQRLRRARVLGKKQRLAFMSQKIAASIIQTRYRALLRGRKQRHAYRKILDSIVAFQARARGHLARQEYARESAARYIQAVYRGYVQRTRFMDIKRSAIVIQRRYRAKRWAQFETAKFQELVRAAIAFQRQWRATSCMRKARHAYLHQRQSAIKLQSTTRMYSARKEYLDLRKSAVTVQRHRRALITSREARASYLKQREATIKLQQRARAFIIGKATREQYLRQKNAAQILQRSWRMHKNRVRNNAATCIQSIWRCHRSRSMFNAKKNAATRISSTYRAVLAKRRYQVIRQSIVSFQSQARGFLARKSIVEHKLERQCILAKWTGATAACLSAIKIQRIYRRFKTYQAAKRQLSAISAIQQWWRARQNRLHYLNQLGLIKTIQRRYRTRHIGRVAAAKKIQSLSHTIIARGKFLRTRYAVGKIQACWRGYNVRKHTSMELEKMRERVRQANEAAEESMKLGNRAALALQLLTTSKQMSLILKACDHLDVATSLSKECCLRLIEHNVVGIIFGLIQSCNRSKPHMEVLKHAVNILCSLSHYEETSILVFNQPDCFEVLVELVQNYREMEGIFITTCRILALQCSYPDRLDAFKSQKEFVRRLLAVQSYVDRKLAMDVKSKKIPERKSKLYELSVALHKTSDLM